MEDLITSIGSMLDEGVYSEKELMWIIKEGIFRYRLDMAIQQVDINSIVRDVFDAFTEHPLSVRTPFFHEKKMMGDVAFYHPHTYVPDERALRDAFERHIDVVNQESIKEMEMKVLIEFFSGYSSYHNGILAFFVKGSYRFVVYPESSIETFEEHLDVHIRAGSISQGGYVVTVPTESSIEPFIKFYRKRAEEIRKGEIKVWVVNPEEGYVDPFIGYPRDPDLIKRFRNPKIASIISSLWRGKVEDLD